LKLERSTERLESRRTLRVEASGATPRTDLLEDSCAVALLCRRRRRDGHLDQCDEPTGRDAELGSERLLADPFCGLDDSENAGISRNEAQHTKSLGKTGGRMASNLRQEKRG
jgi:hypothetical protein